MNYIENKKYTQKEDGSHVVSVLINGEWTDGKALYEDIVFCERGGFFCWGGMNNPIVKKLVQNGIFWRTKYTPIYIGDNKKEIHRFKTELKNAILPVVISD